MKPFILCIGLPGSGKTTTIKLLEQRLEGYFEHNYKDIRRKLGLPAYDLSSDTPEDEARIDECYIHINLRIQRGEGLIIERAGTSEHFRKYYYDWAKEYDSEILVINHQILAAIAKERIAQRDDNPESGYYRYKSNDPRLYDYWAKKWKDPAKDLEKYSHVSMIIYHTDTNTVECVRVSDTIRPLFQEVENILCAHSL